MPKYFFHIRQDSHLSLDEQGVLCADDTAAHREAMAGIRSIVAEQIREGDGVDGQQIEIYDEAGRVVGVVPFSDALRPDDERGVRPPAPRR